MATQNPNPRKRRLSELTTVVTALKLNVGGTYFTTTSNTIEKEGYFPINLIDTGIGNNNYDYFIDRDPTYFRFVLNYLRNGTNVVLPDKTWELRQLNVEAEYYQLSTLGGLIQKEILRIELLDDKSDLIREGLEDIKDEIQSGFSHLSASIPSDEELKCIDASLGNIASIINNKSSYH
eukprot:117872_1